MVDLKSYFHDRYKGGQDFVENVIKPIFGEDRYEDAYEEDVLEDNPELLKMADATGISQIIRMGTIDIPMNPTDVYDITVSSRVQMERNRVKIQSLVRGIMSTYSSAFMVFHYEDDTRWDWRFTFCSKFGSNKEATDSKRYTFLLGPNQSCRTAADNFSKLAQKHGDIELDDIVDAFDVEALSKEFFAKYKAHYEKFCQFVYDNKDNRDYFGQEFSLWEDKIIRDYVKKLLGRIVFLHFLQKKGWLGVPAGKPWGDGDTQFMKHLFEASSEVQKDSYLDMVLEPLFADALNTQRENDVFNLHVEGFTDTKIPYLNGGLFERDELDAPKSVFPAAYFESLFEFLSQYNFTIDENDPNDAEMGIDPEMLGRIFENLLEDNKDKGAFYTPKEIVQYMCRESLIAYLTTCVMKKQGVDHQPEGKIRDAVRELLKTPETIVPKMSKEHLEDFGTYIRKVKICDPAIGSGAFPMGLLNELVRCRASIGAWATDAQGAVLTGDYAALKAEIICNNIYGVDIEKGAVDIARLRFWLSIIVDEQSPHALPNFDYKFMQGNSLIPTFDGQYVNLDTDGQQHVNVDKMKKEKRRLYNLKREHYGATGLRKYQLSVEIKDCILQLISLQLGYELRHWYQQNVVQTSLFPDDEPKQLSFADIMPALPPERQRICDLGAALRAKLNDATIPIEERAQMDIRFFDWRMMFTEVFEGENPGFDIVIGNPPFVESRSSSVDEKQKDAIQKQLRLRHINDDADCFPRGADLLIFFFELSFNISSLSGINTFITENSWLSTDYGSKFQKYILKNINTLGIVDSDYKYFDSADINTVITFFENRGLRTLQEVSFVHCHGDLSIHPYNIQENSSKDETITVNSFNVSDEILSNHKWGFLFSIDNRVLELLKIISKKEDREFRRKIDIGQGLNLTKDCILTQEIPNSSPYYISDNGPLYRWTESQYYVDNKNASATRKKPILILPRGLGTHFCCMNEVCGYSASYVEIYERLALSFDDKLRLWAFCNSSLCWALRELTGRCNLGGGMLKAEATDLKKLPLCFNFDNIEEIRNIYDKCRGEKVSTNIDEAVGSVIHKRIDRLVYGYFGLPENSFVTELLLGRFHWRTDKSRNKKKKNTL